MQSTYSLITQQNVTLKNYNMHTDTRLFCSLQKAVIQSIGSFQYLAIEDIEY